MRKLMLGAVLLAAMLPVTTVYAAATAEMTATVKKMYKDGKNSKGAKKSAEDAIAGRPSGMTVLEAMTALIEEDSNNAPFAVTAAIKAEPDNAGEITKFALGKAPTKSAAITSAALATVSTPAERREVAAAAAEQGVSVSVINTQLKDVTTKANGAYEQFAVDSKNNTSTISTVTPAPKNTQQETVGTTTGVSAAPSQTITQTVSGGGGVCDPKKASCT
jgi:hypothetical protein